MTTAQTNNNAPATASGSTQAHSQPSTAPKRSSIADGPVALAVAVPVPTTIVMGSPAVGTAAPKTLVTATPKIAPAVTPGAKKAAATTPTQPKATPEKATAAATVTPGASAKKATATTPPTPTSTVQPNAMTTPSKAVATATGQPKVTPVPPKRTPPTQAQAKTAPMVTVAAKAIAAPAKTAPSATKATAAPAKEATPTVKAGATTATIAKTTTAVTTAKQPRVAPTGARPTAAKQTLPIVRAIATATTATATKATTTAAQSKGATVPKQSLPIVQAIATTAATAAAKSRAAPPATKTAASNQPTPIVRALLTTTTAAHRPVATNTGQPKPAPPSAAQTTTTQESAATIRARNQASNIVRLNGKFSTQRKVNKHNTEAKRQATAAKHPANPYTSYLPPGTSYNTAGYVPPPGTATPYASYVAANTAYNHTAYMPPPSANSPYAGYVPPGTVYNSTGYTTAYNTTAYMPPPHNSTPVAGYIANNAGKHGAATATTAAAGKPKAKGKAKANAKTGKQDETEVVVIDNDDDDDDDDDSVESHQQKEKPTLKRIPMTHELELALQDVTGGAKLTAQLEVINIDKEPAAAAEAEASAEADTAAAAAAPTATATAAPAEAVPATATKTTESPETPPAPAPPRYVAIMKGKDGLENCIFLSMENARQFLNSFSVFKEFKYLDEADSYLVKNTPITKLLTTQAPAASTATINAAGTLTTMQNASGTGPTTPQPRASTAPLSIHHLPPPPLKQKQFKLNYTVEQLKAVAKLETLEDTPTKLWWDMYTDLLTFHKRHGNLLIRPDKSILSQDRILGESYVPLVIWIAEQRVQYKESKERIKEQRIRKIREKYLTAHRKSTGKKGGKAGSKKRAADDDSDDPNAVRRSRRNRKKVNYKEKKHIESDDNSTSSGCESEYSDDSFNLERRGRRSSSSSHNGSDLPTSMKVTRLEQLGFSWTVTPSEIKVARVVARTAETSVRTIDKDGSLSKDIFGEGRGLARPKENAAGGKNDGNDNDSSSDEDSDEDTFDAKLVKTGPSDINDDPTVKAIERYAKCQSFLDAINANSVAAVDRQRHKREFKRAMHSIQSSRKVHSRWQQMMGKMRDFKEKYGHTNVYLAINGLTKPIKRRRVQASNPAPTATGAAANGNGADEEPETQPRETGTGLVGGSGDAKNDDAMETEPTDNDKEKNKDDDNDDDDDEFIPIESYKQLKVWADNQRRFYREWQAAGRINNTNSKGTFCADKERMLTEIGFDLNVDKRMYRKPGARWEASYKKLKEYGEANDGDFEITKAMADEDPSLQDIRRFSIEQRAQFRYLKDGQLSTMSEEKRQRLLAIGFPLVHVTFEDRVKQLKEHMDKTGGKVFNKGHELSKWAKKVKTQIQRFDAGKGCRITKDQVDQLKALGFEAGKSYDPVDDLVDEHTWDEQFARLKAYSEEHGDCLVNTNPPLDDFKKWVRLQRVQYRRLQAGKPTRLTALRLQKLYDVGFMFRQKPNYWSFNDRLEQLKEYKAKHGHTRVPVMEGALGAFVSSCRTEYGKRTMGRPNTMKDDRLAALEAIEFEFNVGKRLGPQNGRKSWDERFQQLLRYKAEHGDTVVPQHFVGYNNLGKWVQAQRKNYKKLRSGNKTSLSPDRVAQLEQIGFVWDASYKLRKQPKPPPPANTNAVDQTVEMTEPLPAFPQQIANTVFQHRDFMQHLHQPQHHHQQHHHHQAPRNLMRRRLPTASNAMEPPNADAIAAATAAAAAAAHAGETLAERAADLFSNDYDSLRRTFL